MSEVRVRIAPSPTGDPHVGTAYIALFNLAFAKRHGGKFVLRIEDTDQRRSTRESEDAIYRALHWLGLNWDEGPDVGGDYGPYRQSERTALYREHAQILLDKGLAYRCFATKEELNAIRTAKQKAKQPVWNDVSRSLTSAEVEQKLAAGVPHTIRMKIDRSSQTIVNDRLRGDIVFENTQIDDQILLKADGFPTYHLANVVDDHMMKITHVIRGEEWIPSTPKHVFLYAAFGWEAPEFIHLPLLRNADKSKLSKRRNPVNIDYYRSLGVLPEALVNYLGMMSYSMPDEREKFTIDEFFEAFDIDRVKLSGPVFGVDKLTWLNGVYLRDLSPVELVQQLRDTVYSTEFLTKVAALIQPRMSLLNDAAALTSFFHRSELDYDAQLLIPKTRDKVQMRKAFKTLATMLDGVRDWTPESIMDALNRFCTDNDFKRKEVFMPVRIAVTGTKTSPDLMQTMAALGGSTCRQRLRAARLKLK